MRDPVSNKYIKSSSEYRRDSRARTDQVCRTVRKHRQGNASTVDIFSDLLDVMFSGEGFCRRLMDLRRRSSLGKPDILKANKAKKVKRARTGRRRK